ncbi:MAG: hypothetical protein MK207_09330 [Saprospiraceae bacterium]|nr:hypothetical protein [Saprospiraceae bacterium]
MKPLFIHLIFLFMIVQLHGQSNLNNKDILECSIHSKSIVPIEKSKGSEVYSLKLSIPMIGVVVVKNPTFEVQKLTKRIYTEKKTKEIEAISYSKLENK